MEGITHAYDALERADVVLLESATSPVHEQYQESAITLCDLH